MADVVAIGQPVNEVERDAIAFLRDHLPDDYLVCHNVELGEPGRAPYEFDIVVVGEHAVYSVEVKGFYGRVTGNKRDWTVDGRPRRSPLSLAFQKARVLAGMLRRHRPPVGQIWIEAVVFLAHPQVDANFPDSVAEHVRTRETIIEALTDPEALHRPHWPIQPAGPKTRTIRNFLLGGRPSPGRTHVGPYRLLGQIGQTELFTDYEATNEALLIPDESSRPVARLRLYRVDPYGDPETIETQRQRGIWEASVLRWLGPQPGLVSAGDPFFPRAEDVAVALPFEQSEGVTLRSFLESHGTLGETQTLERFGPALQALALAHSRGIVHRRITPDSFLCGPDEPFRLADFAFSTHVAAGRPIDRQFLHRRYAAPELLAGEPATTASDIFSFGAVLATALLGALPFDDSRELLPPEGLPANELGDAVRASLDPDPAQRPHDGYALIERLVPSNTEDGRVIRQAQATLFTAGTVVNDRYRIVRRLGPPRTRTTYRAEHLTAQQPRVLRTIETTITSKERLRASFARLYCLRHHSLLCVSDFDAVRSPSVQPPIFIFDVEYAGDRTAQDAIDAGGLGVTEAARIGALLCDAVSYLHTGGDHHAGISAAAVFLTDDGGCRLGPPPSLLPREALTPPMLAYLDPARPACPAEDGVALAIVIWSLATGQHPFPGGLRTPGARPQLEATDEQARRLAAILMPLIHGQQTLPNLASARQSLSELT